MIILIKLKFRNVEKFVWGHIVAGQGVSWVIIPKSLIFLLEGVKTYIIFCSSTFKA
jgi:hypothetical protein